MLLSVKESQEYKKKKKRLRGENTTDHQILPLRHKSKYILPWWWTELTWRTHRGCLTIVIMPNTNRWFVTCRALLYGLLSIKTFNLTIILCHRYYYYLHFTVITCTVSGRRKWNRRVSLFNQARENLGDHGGCANCSVLILKYPRAVKGKAGLEILLVV